MAPTVPASDTGMHTQGKHTHGNDGAREIMKGRIVQGEIMVPASDTQGKHAQGNNGGGK